MVQLALKNKWQYALLHGHRTWVSTELLSPWDLGGQWNKLALLSALFERGRSAQGVRTSGAPPLSLRRRPRQDRLVC